jgi:dTDP-glucose 4,6-dehydratase
MTNPSVLITGGAGFLGSHMCDRLVSEGFIVLCLDSLITGSRVNLEHLLKHSRFAFLQHDVTEPFPLPLLLRRLANESSISHAVEEIDYVLHMASPASPLDYARYPIATLRVGAQGTYNALELAREHNAIFMLSSTSEVYGDPDVNPQPETYWGRVNPIGPRSMYDESKRYAEALTSAFCRTYAMDVRIARIFNCYGPRMGIEDGRVIPNFMTQALLHKPLTVFGDGSQTRSLCYVDDMVEGLFRLLTMPKTTLQVGSTAEMPEPTIVNIGNPEEVSMLELAREIISVTDSPSDISFKPLPTDDPMQRRPDIALANRLLDWSPAVPRSEGLTRVKHYFAAALGR